MKVKLVLMAVVLSSLVACSGYITPDDSFMKAEIQFVEKKFNKQSLAPEAFVSALQKVVVGGKETDVQGWKKEGRSMILHAAIGGIEYEFIFTDVMTDNEGKTRVVFQSVKKNGQNTNSEEALEIILGN